MVKVKFSNQISPSLKGPLNNTCTHFCTFFSLIFLEGWGMSQSPYNLNTFSMHEYYMYAILFPKVGKCASIITMRHQRFHILQFKRFVHRVILLMLKKFVIIHCLLNSGSRGITFRCSTEEFSSLPLRRFVLKFNVALCRQLLYVAFFSR